MRMWMLSPAEMCLKHLCGEHGEIHKHRHNFAKGHSISGRVSPVVQIEPESMQARHDDLEIAIRMRNPASKCNSPYTMPDLSYLSDAERCAKVDIETSRRDLSARCSECAERISHFIYNFRS